MKCLNASPVETFLGTNLGVGSTTGTAFDPRVGTRRHSGPRSRSFEGCRDDLTYALVQNK